MITAASAKNKSAHSFEAEPNAAPSELAGSTAPAEVIEDAFVIVPEISTFPFISIVAPFNSSSVSASRSKVPSAL